MLHMKLKGGGGLKYLTLDPPMLMPDDCQLIVCCQLVAYIVVSALLQRNGHLCTHTHTHTHTHWRTRPARHQNNKINVSIELRLKNH